MVPRDRAIQALMEAFPAHSAAIQREFSQSEYFRSICKDFHACSQAITYWDKIASGEAAVRSEEYRELLRELEREVLNWLEARGGHADTQRESTTEADPD